MNLLTDIRGSEVGGQLIVENFAALDTRVAGYAHEQTVATSTWNVAHNFGYYPTSFSLIISGQVHYADVVHVDENNLQVRLNANKTGTFKCL